MVDKQAAYNRAAELMGDPSARETFWYFIQSDYFDAAMESSFRTFADGMAVGRNNMNALVFQCANGNDVWMMYDANGGNHVIGIVDEFIHKVTTVAPELRVGFAQAFFEMVVAYVSEEKGLTFEPFSFADEGGGRMRFQAPFWRDDPGTPNFFA